MEVGLILGLLLATATAKPDSRTAYACEGGQLHITCEEGCLIHLIRANYGRFSISICNEHGSLEWSVDCTSHRSYYVIYERCNLMSSCIVSANSDTFADPCPGTSKYLEVQYQCMQESVPTSSSSTVALSTTTKTTRPPIIIPLTRSNRPTVLATPFVLTSTPTQKAFGTAETPIFNVSSTTKANIIRSTTSITLLNNEEHCQPVQSRNLTWDWTKAGTLVTQKCPGGTFGEARWHCGIDPVRWVPDTPDLSDCSSLWMENLRARVDSGDSVVNIAAELSVMTHRKPLYGGDLRHAADILHRLVSKMAEKMKEIADDKQRHQLLQELLECAGDVTSNLLEVSSSWKELLSSERTYVASTLFDTLERSGWLLASAHKSAFSFRKTLRNLVMSVRVLEALAVSHVTFPSPEDVAGTPWEQMGDCVHLPIQTLLSTASNGVVKMVFASYKRAKDFLGTVASSRKGILHNSSRIINSRIISASTGKFPATKFTEPITVTFKLIQEENVTNPQCVYWDFDTRFWSQDGCRLQKANRTHAICECDHLTNFALLMELKSRQESTGASLLSKFVIFTSCVLASTFLFITVLLLQVFRSCSTDHSTIRKHLCVCLMLAEIVYVSGDGKVDTSCAVSAGLLHFLLQAVFVWLFLSALQQYFTLLEPAYSSRFLCYSVVAYGMPALIVSVSAFIDPQSYGTLNYCFLRFDNYYVFSFLGPAIPCILGAIIFLGLTVCRICLLSSAKNKEIVKVSSVRSRHQEAWLVVLCCGGSWTCLLLYMQRRLTLLAYAFAALNILQGIIALVSFGFKNNEVQNAYRKWKDGSYAQAKNTESQFPLSITSSQQSIETPYLQSSTTVSSLSTVQAPDLEFQLSTFRHSTLCQTTRSPIYDNREQLVS